MKMHKKLIRAFFIFSFVLFFSIIFHQDVAFATTTDDADKGDITGTNSYTFHYIVTPGASIALNVKTTNEVYYAQIQGRSKDYTFVYGDISVLNTNNPSCGTKLGDSITWAVIYKYMQIADIANIDDLDDDDWNLINT